MKTSSKVQVFLFFAILIPLLFGCEKGTWLKHERQQIKEYIDSLGDTAYVLKPSGLYFIELRAGTGRTPLAKDTVYFKYKGCFLDGVSFISNLTDTVPYKLVVGVDKVVAGIDEGVRYMKEGGKARLVLPSSLAYGAEGWWGVIPGYTPVFWEIDLLTVKAGPGK